MSLPTHPFHSASPHKLPTQPLHSTQPLNSARHSRNLSATQHSFTTQNSLFTLPSHINSPLSLPTQPLHPASPSSPSTKPPYTASPHSLPTLFSHTASLDNLLTQPPHIVLLIVHDSRYFISFLYRQYNVSLCKMKLPLGGANSDSRAMICMILSEVYFIILQPNCPLWFQTLLKSFFLFC